MKRGLLLGNGINQCIGINELSVANIFLRFKKNAVRYDTIAYSFWRVHIDDKFVDEVDMYHKNAGIETLADVLYNYIKGNFKKKDLWSDNDEYRLQDFVTCLCITSIFYNENAKIGTTYKKSLLPDISKYDVVYTLNYIEFWDLDKRCQHLHGSIDWAKLQDCEKTLLVSKDRMSISEYRQATQEIQKNYNIIEIRPNEIVFAPESIQKDKLVCVSGIHPSEKLFPANDLFFYREKKLYGALSDVDELDIFGMSPQGDDSLISKINEMKNVRVFVYQKDINNQTKEWMSKLTCKYEVLDSNEIYT